MASHRTGADPSPTVDEHRAGWGASARCGAATALALPRRVVVRLGELALRRDEVVVGLLVDLPGLLQQRRDLGPLLLVVHLVALDGRDDLGEALVEDP